MIPGSTHIHSSQKGNATFQKITELTLVAMGYQQFCERRGKMCTQIIEYPEKTV